MLQGNEHCKKEEPSPAVPKENMKDSHQVVREAFTEKSFLNWLLEESWKLGRQIRRARARVKGKVHRRRNKRMHLNEQSILIKEIILSN